jgi:hypothetical protein
VQSLSFVLTLPVFIMVMLMIVQVSQLMIGTVVVHSGKIGNHFYVACSEPNRGLIDVMSTDKVHPVVLNSVFEAFAG